MICLLGRLSEFPWPSNDGNGIAFGIVLRRGGRVNPRPTAPLAVLAADSCQGLAEKVAGGLLGESCFAEASRRNCVASSFVKRNGKIHDNSLQQPRRSSAHHSIVNVSSAICQGCSSPRSRRGGGWRQLSSQVVFLFSARFGMVWVQTSPTSQHDTRQGYREKGSPAALGCRRCGLVARRDRRFVPQPNFIEGDFILWFVGVKSAHRRSARCRGWRCLRIPPGVLVRFPHKLWEHMPDRPPPAHWWKNNSSGTGLACSLVFPQQGLAAMVRGSLPNGRRHPASSTSQPPTFASSGCSMPVRGLANPRGRRGEGRGSRPPRIPAWGTSCNIG